MCYSSPVPLLRLELRLPKEPDLKSGAASIFAIGALAYLTYRGRESNPPAPDPKSSGSPAWPTSAWCSREDSNLQPPQSEYGASAKLGYASMFAARRMPSGSPSSGPGRNCYWNVDLAGFEPATNVDGGIPRFPAEGSGSLSCGLLHHGLGPGASANPFSVMPRPSFTPLFL